MSNLGVYFNMLYLRKMRNIIPFFCRVEREYFLSLLGWLVQTLTLCLKWFSILISIRDMSKLAVDLHLWNIDLHLIVEYILTFFSPCGMEHNANSLWNVDRWDMLTADLELVETIDGYCDVVYGTYEPKYLNKYFPIIIFICTILMQS